MASRSEVREQIDKLLDPDARAVDAEDEWGTTPEAQAEMDRFMTI